MESIYLNKAFGDKRVKIILHENDFEIVRYNFLQKEKERYRILYSNVRLIDSRSFAFGFETNSYYRLILYEPVDKKIEFCFPKENDSIVFSLPLAEINRERIRLIDEKFGD